MNYYEVQDFFKKLYPNEVVRFEFDEKCHRFLEIVHTDGLPNLMHHCECDKVKVNVGWMDPMYVSILPHRMNLSWADVKNLITGKNDVWIHPDDIKNLKSLKEQDYEDKISELESLSGLERSIIERKL